MGKVLVLYHSDSGNTEAMARLAEGAGFIPETEIRLREVDATTPDQWLPGRFALTSPGTVFVMFRIAVTLLILASSAANADDGVPVKILARGAWPHLPTHSSAGIGTDRAPITRVIRSDAELSKAAGDGARVTTAKAFKVPAIDFEKHMILAVEDGTQPMVG